MGFCGAERNFQKTGSWPVAFAVPQPKSRLRLVDVAAAALFAAAIVVLLQPLGAIKALGKEKSQAISMGRAIAQSLLGYAEDADGALPRLGSIELPKPESADYRWAQNACLARTGGRALPDQVVLAAQTGWLAPAEYPASRAWPAALEAPDRVQAFLNDPQETKGRFHGVSNRYSGAAVYVMVSGATRVFPESVLRLGNDGSGCDSRGLGLTGSYQQPRFAGEDMTRIGPGKGLVASDAMVVLKQRLEKMAKREREARAKAEARKKAQVASVSPVGPGLPL